ncbi:MAG: ABC transporter permease [Acidobacteriota bacterium]|jgi:putative ABC transport system permease protein
MAALLQDIRFRLRAIAHHPAITIVAVASLALGIGANTALFSVVDGMYLRPWSVERPDELVWIYHRGLEGQADTMAYADYLDIRRQSSAFSGAVAESRRGGLLNVHGELNQVLVNVVSDNFFSVLGVDAALGRTFTEQQDGSADADAGVILSHDLWTRLFGQDPRIVGEQIELTGNFFPVVGVMPPTFRGLRRQMSVDLWVSPAAWTVLSGGSRAEFENRAERQFDVLGRLRPDATLAEAEAQLSTIAARLAETYPDTNRDRTFYAVSEASERRSSGLAAGLLLMSIVGVVLLIACANVAILVLADTEARNHETVVRLALGAGRMRLVRQFLAESLIVAVLATIVGLLFAWSILQVFPSLMPPGPITVSPDLRLDHRVLTVTLLASLITLFLFGLAPALQASRHQIVGGLKREEASIRKGRGAFSLRNILVVTQMALCVALMTGAGLLLRSFLYSQRISPGFDTEQPMLITSVSRAPSEQTPQAQLWARLAQEIQALPGVRRVTWARRIPLAGSGGGAARMVRFPGREPVSIKYNQLAPNYFEVMGTRILRGRPFSAADRADAAPVAMVNEMMAKRFWPGADPVGRNLRIGDEDREVVAVVEDGRVNDLHEPPEPLFYLPYAQAPSGDTTMLIATDTDPTPVAGSVRQLLRDHESSIRSWGLITLSEHMRAALYQDRLPAQVGGALGILGVLLAAIGLFGVISRLVNQRQREFGIRIALGAPRVTVLKLVLAQGLRLSLVGIALGIGLALIVGRLMASSLHGVSPADPLTLALSCLVVTGVALLASHLPTRRATRVDPVRVLRNE